MSYFTWSNIGLSAWQKEKTIYFEVLLKTLSSIKLFDLRLWVAGTFSSAKMSESTRNLAGSWKFDGSS